MAFKIGSAADLDRFPITDQAVITALRDYLTIFDNVYGSDRNIEEKGGYALYLSKDDSLQELTKWYNTDDIIEPEFVDEIIGAEVPYCIAVYIIGTEYGIVVAIPADERYRLWLKKTKRKFKVRITETLEEIMEVEADNNSDAITSVRQRYDNYEIVLRCEHFTGVRFEAEEDNDDN